MYSNVMLLRSDRETHNSKHADMCPIFLSQSDHSNSRTFINPQNPEGTVNMMTFRSKENGLLYCVEEFSIETKVGWDILKG